MAKKKKSGVGPMPEIVDGMATHYAPTPKSVAEFLMKKNIEKQIRSETVGFAQQIKHATAMIIQANPGRKIAGANFLIIYDSTGKVQVATNRPLPGSTAIRGVKYGEIQSRCIDLSGHWVKAQKFIRVTSRIDSVSMGLLQKTMANPCRTQPAGTGLKSRLTKVIAKSKINPARHSRVMKTLRKSQAR